LPDLFRIFKSHDENLLKENEWIFDGKQHLLNGNKNPG